MGDISTTGTNNVSSAGQSGLSPVGNVGKRDDATNKPNVTERELEIFRGHGSKHIPEDRMTPRTREFDLTNENNVAGFPIVTEKDLQAAKDSIHSQINTDAKKWSDRMPAIDESKPKPISRDDRDGAEKHPFNRF